MFNDPLQKNTKIRTFFKKWRWRIAVAVLVGMVGCIGYLIPQSTTIEEKLGLYWLFHLRGAISASPDVVVIAIDQLSATQLNLPAEPHLWPRDLHALLIERITKAGAEVIAFDLIFKKSSRDSDNDLKLAEAIKKSHNIVLAERLKYRDIDLLIEQDNQGLPLDKPAEERANKGCAELTAPLEKEAGNLNLIFPLLEKSQASIIGECVEKTVPEIAEFARAQSPFPLPRTSQVNKYWTFRPSAGDMPTFPVAVLQFFALQFYDNFTHLLNTVDPVLAAQLPSKKDNIDIEDLILTLRNEFINKPQLAPAMLNELKRNSDLGSEQRRILRAMINLYAGKDVRYLNFYGPPRSLRTISYYNALQINERSAGSDPSFIDLKGKAIFIGFSAATQSEQDKIRDDYDTVFSQPDGLFISGVEIAATAFANLLDDRAIQTLPLKGTLFVLFLAGFIVCLIFLKLANLSAFIVCILLIVVYGYVAHYLFNERYLWLPTIIPLALIIMSFFGMMLWKYIEFQKTMNVFKLSSGTSLSDNQLIHGSCLASDIENYTKLTETMDPIEHSLLMKNYYAILREIVNEQKNGVVSDLGGDSMIAIWAAASENIFLHRKQACLACLRIATAIERFNQNSCRPQLSTRMGLHSGKITWGKVGAVYRAMGDTVNTASRIQGVNKYMGTRILLSIETLDGLTDFLVRPLGDFLLVGKSIPIGLAELITIKQEASSEQTWLCEVFSEGLQFYRSQDWISANRHFFTILKVFPDDGPTRFYWEQCQEYQRTPPTKSWNWVIHLKTK